MVDANARLDSRLDALLDAHVAFEVARLTGVAQAETVGGVFDDVLAALGDHQVADLVDADALTSLVTYLLEAAGSPLVGGVVEVVTEVVHAGPDTPPLIADVVDREQVEALVDEMLALAPVYERALEQLTDSPLVGTVAARFMGRVVGEVVATNQEIANKVPGLGSLVSLGTSAATRMKGAADKPLEALLGNSVGTAGSFAVRRLTKIIIDTLRDPLTREAAMQAWDLAAQERLGGLGEHVDLDEATGVVDAVHALIVTAMGHQAVPILAGVLVEAFLDRFGGYSAPELLEQLELDPAQVRRRLVDLAPTPLGELADSGDLERLVRSRLAPFYESEAARALLKD